MQQIFMGLLVGAVQPAVLCTAVAVIDFIYYLQLQVHTSQTLRSLQKALKTFHKNKAMFVTKGIREHFNIPKIHAMVHYVAAIQSQGSADGFNTESLEWLHINYAKEVYQVSNKKKYVHQMTVWLGRQEAVAQFRAYLDYVAALDIISNDGLDSDLNDNEEDRKSVV